MPLLDIETVLAEPAGQDGLRLSPVRVKKIYKRRSGEKPATKGGTYWYSFEDLIVEDETGEMTLTLNGCKPAAFLGITEGCLLQVEAGPDKNGKLVGVMRQDDTYGDPPKTTKKLLIKGYAKITIQKSGMSDIVLDKGLWLDERSESGGYDMRPEPKAAPVATPKTLQDLQETGQVRSGSTLRPPLAFGPKNADEARSERIQKAVDDFFDAARIFMGELATRDSRFCDSQSKLPMTATEAMQTHPWAAEFILTGLGGCLNRASR